MHQAPFTVYFTYRPKGNSRNERLRHAQKASVLLYTYLQTLTTINTAAPGGSQNALYNIYNFTNIMEGLQIKPQFGESPAQMVITGFYEVAGQNEFRFPNRQVIFAGRHVYGPANSHLAQGDTTDALDAEVKALKVLLDGSVSHMNGIYPDLAMKVYRMDYKGIIFGNRGLTFPK